MSPIEEYGRLYPANLSNRLFQSISVRLTAAPNAAEYYTRSGQKEKAAEVFRLYQEAYNQLQVYFMTEELSVPLLAANFVPVKQLGQWMSMEGIERWEGYYEKDGI